MQWHSNNRLIWVFMLFLIIVRVLLELYPEPPLFIKDRGRFIAVARGKDVLIRNFTLKPILVAKPSAKPCPLFFRATVREAPQRMDAVERLVGMLF